MVLDVSTSLTEEKNEHLIDKNEHDDDIETEDPFDTMVNKSPLKFSDVIPKTGSIKADDSGGVNLTTPTELIDDPKLTKEVHLTLDDLKVGHGKFLQNMQMSNEQVSKG